MRQKENKLELTENELNLPENFREEQFLHTVASDKRHELLMAPYGVSFPVFRTLVYLLQHPELLELPAGTEVDYEQSH